MSDDGTTKDDVKSPDNEVGEKIKKLFHDDGKDTSELNHDRNLLFVQSNKFQTSSFSLPWVRRLPSMLRRLQNKCTTYETGSGRRLSGASVGGDIMNDDSK